MLGKLFEISKGKNSYMASLKSSSQSSLKSLHYVQKKREIERIEAENLKMMDRIMHQGKRVVLFSGLASVGSTISIAKMKQDYDRNKG